MSALPLDGHLVLDLSIAQSGPVMAWQLGALGATVVKVERVPPAGQWPRTSIDLGSSYADGIAGEHPWNRDSLFNAIHRNKKSIALNLGIPRGRELFLGLSDQASVIVENFSARVMKGFALDYPVLSERNRRLVYVSIKAHGAGGPKGSYSGFHSTANAEAGLGWLLNYGDDIPQSIGWPAADLISSAWAGALVMAALVDARDTGQGRFIDLSMTEAVAGLLDDFVVQAQLEPEPWVFGSQPDPVHSVECADGEWLAVSVRDALSAGSCGTNDDEVVARLKALAVGCDRPILQAKLTSDGIRTSAVLRATDILRDPPVSDFWTEIDHADVGPRQYVTPPFLFEPQLPLRSEPAPLHAEHTDEVLARFLRLTAQELDQLRADGVVL